MSESYERYDISDNLWALIEPHTISNKGAKGGKAKDTRKFINAVFWLLRTGVPYRDLPGRGELKVSRELSIHTYRKLDKMPLPTGETFYRH